MNRINEEVGVRNLTKIIKNKQNCEIYFHKDLDGVTSAIAMKEFLKTYYNINIEDAHIIQYGGLEFAIKNTKPGNLAVLVDFAHGKPMFHIQSDHHDKQISSEDTSTYFKAARSNLETISGEISYSDIFTSTDLKLINTVDSADFHKYNITPEHLHNSIFKLDKLENSERNRFMMGLVVNRLLLAYKNKKITIKSSNGKHKHESKNFLECLVMDSNASLYSMFNNIKYYIKNTTLAKPVEIMDNLNSYIERMRGYNYVETQEEDQIHELNKKELYILQTINDKTEPQVDKYVELMRISSEEVHKLVDWLMMKKFVYFDEKSLKYKLSKLGKRVKDEQNKPKTGIHFDDQYNIILQYGGGNMFSPGSYDRYVPFRNYSDADFLCIIWPMGLIQMSYSPFKEKKLNVNLGQLATEVLAKFETKFRKIYIPLDALKNEYENSKEWNAYKKDIGEEYEGVGFKYFDLKSFYSDVLYSKVGKRIININIDDDMLKSSMNTLYADLTEEQKTYLNSIKIPIWEIMLRNSGGHPSITNIASINFLKYNKKATEFIFKTDKYTDVLKTIARELVNSLKEKIDMWRKDGEVKYDTKGIKLLGQSTNESKKIITKFSKFLG